MNTSHDPRVIIALDFPDADEVRRLVTCLDPGACKLKIGFELFVAAGPELVRELVDSGFDIFLDLKYHDIPNTVAAACDAAARLGVWMLNVHAVGGKAMLEAARDAVHRAPVPPKLIAVTVLTSMDNTDLKQIGVVKGVQQQVLDMAVLTSDCGLDGVVCSANESQVLRSQFGSDFLLVTPGIRPQGVGGHDQKRVMTPANAITCGSSYLVIGRAITRAPDPAQMLATINTEINSVLST